MRAVFPSLRTCYQKQNNPLPKGNVRKVLTIVKTPLIFFSHYSTDKSPRARLLDRNTTGFLWKASDGLCHVPVQLKTLYQPSHVHGCQPNHHSQEKVFHDIVVIRPAAVWQKTGSKHNDGIQAVPIVSWGQIKRYV